MKTKAHFRTATWRLVRGATLGSKLLLAMLLLVAVAGCGRRPKMREGFAEAYGTVTLDGQPLVNAQIVFETEKGTSYGRTDSSGRYEAEYSRSLKGAGIGQACVAISTKVVFPDEDSSTLALNPKTGEHEKPELVPARYNKASELVVNVTEDGAPYDFTLTSN